MFCLCDAGPRSLAHVHHDVDLSGRAQNFHNAGLALSNHDVNLLGLMFSNRDTGLWGLLELGESSSSLVVDVGLAPFGSEVNRKKCSWSLNMDRWGLTSKSREMGFYQPTFKCHIVALEGLV